LILKIWQEHTEKMEISGSDGASPVCWSLML
jgi:hypothetical protein